MNLTGVGYLVTFVFERVINIRLLHTTHYYYYCGNVATDGSNSTVVRFASCQLLI